LGYSRWGWGQHLSEPRGAVFIQNKNDVSNPISPWSRGGEKRLNKGFTRKGEAAGRPAWGPNGEKETRVGVAKAQPPQSNEAKPVLEGVLIKESGFANESTLRGQISSSGPSPTQPKCNCRTLLPKRNGSVKVRPGDGHLGGKGTAKAPR